jgi:hypothetical protein
VLQHGHHERAEYNLSVPWASAVASPSGAGDDAIAGVLQPWGGNNSDTPRLKLNSVEKGVVVASSELMTADEFESRSLRTRGRKRNLVALQETMLKLEILAAVCKKCIYPNSDIPQI